jgi:anti-sigma factor RsiW
MSDQSNMTCEDAMRFLAAYLDDELAGGVRQSVERHLEICRGCYSRAEFERRLKSEIGKLRRDEISAGFEQRIRSLLNSFSPSGDKGPTAN